jgi:hypothetical protein
VSQGKAFEQVMNTGQTDYALVILERLLIVLAQATITTQPSEGAFDNPALGKT